MSQPTKLVVTTNSGPIRGVLRDAIFGQKFVSFQGIPYVQPPIGDLRFKVYRIIFLFRIIHTLYLVF